MIKVLDNTRDVINTAFKLGNYYKHKEYETIYLCSSIGINRVSLINLENGNRYTDNIEFVKPIEFEFIPVNKVILE